jgi:hypothetical protein
LIVIIQELIQIHSYGALTRYKGKILITTKRVGSEDPIKMTRYQVISLKKINNKRVDSTTQ